MEDDDFGTRPLTTLRGIVPIVHTITGHGLALTLFVLEDYAEGFGFRFRLRPLAGHPVLDVMEARRAAGFARLRALAEEHRQGKTSPIAPMVFHEEWPTSEDDPWWPDPRWVVRDDLGNEYECRSWGGGEHATGEFLLRAEFEPALADSARTLVIDVGEVAWATVPPMVADAPPVRVDPGPWIFSVDLTAGMRAMVTVEAT